MRIARVSECRDGSAEVPVRRQVQGRIRLWATALLAIALSPFCFARQLQDGVAMPSMPGNAVGSVSVPGRALAGHGVYQSAGTKKMAALLRTIFDGTDWQLDSNKPEQRVRYYEALLERRKLNPDEDAAVRLQLSKELLYAGRSEAAIGTLEELRRRWRDAGRALTREQEQHIGEWLAISYLRLGEQGKLRAHARTEGVPLSDSRGSRSPAAARRGGREARAVRVARSRS